MSAIASIVLLAAASSSSNPYTPSFPGWIIAWWICSRRKKQQIGGWLLFYYWQLYSGALVSIIFFVVAFQSYVPESYDDPNRYYLFLASIVPTLVLFAVQLAVATMLVSVRTWDLIRLLRWVMIGELVADALGLIIDLNYFAESLPFDLLTIVPATIWLAYFFKSRRVMHVFKLHDWETAVKVIYPPKFGFAT